ncbi:hypothetical protein VHEMI00170 [[Torrubiella] hemipterigena]|uniref:Centromere protein X n=1 Tax=[Torrubiella] hemipterigena TaxID=1531966 RepID=A0A0A1T1G4_9HYPO|nr:hypothetical protein VHEMI00170 [[Torrubiella] hemipterigena]
MASHQSRNGKRTRDVDSESDSSNGRDSGADRAPARRPAQARRDEPQTTTQEDDASNAIPRALVRRILNEFFENDNTAISKNANDAISKYVEVFLQEAIARTAVEKRSGFLEVEDLEKIAPQLLLDL